MAYDFELLTVETSGRVATVIIDNPPANVITKQKVTDNFCALLRPPSRHCAIDI